MLKGSTLATLLLLFGLGLGATEAADSNRIGELIGRLGSTKFQDRNLAQKELEALGAAALEQLKKSMETTDLETSKRAGELVRRIEEKILTAGLLEPRRVRFKVTDMPVLDAVNELAKLSGYPIQVLGDRTKVTGKKITLDTGTVTFWEAFDKLSTLAGLMEQVASPEEPSGKIKGLQFNPPVPAGIILVPGTTHREHASYAGSVRSSVYARTENKSSDYRLILGEEYRLTLEASAEPRLHGFTILGTPAIGKALDDQGQNLLLIADPVPEITVRVGRFGRIASMPNMPLQRQVNLRYQAGKKPAKKLQELSGSITVQVSGPPETLITLPNVLKATGASAHGKSGGLLKLNTIDKRADGQYLVQVYIEHPPGQNALGGLLFGNGLIQMQQLQIMQQLQAQGGGPGLLGNVQGLLELLDAKGNKYQATQVPSRSININNGAVAQEITIHFQGHNGLGVPDSLILRGSRLVNVTIPFAFHNVPLE